MAGDWTPACKSLPRKREVLAIAAAVGMSRREVVGTLLDFWLWVDDVTNDGDLPGLTFASVSQALSISEDFLASMVAVGWLKKTKSGLSIPNFSRWLGAEAVSRMLKTKRQGKWRAKHLTSNGFVTCVDALVDASVDASASTQTSQTSPSLSPSSLPPSSPPITPSTPPNSSPSDPPSPSLRGGEAGQTRKRDELFDAVAEVTSSDPAVSGSHIGRLCKLLRQADPAYTPGEVRSWAELVQSLPWWQGSAPSLGFMEKDIGRIRAKPAERKAKPDARTQAILNARKAKECPKPS